MQSITHGLSQNVKRFGKCATLCVVSLGLSLGAIGTVVQSAKASPASCSGTWERSAIAFLRIQLGQMPDTVSCYSMWEGEQDRTRIRFNRDGNYVVAAECDEDCGDVDLRIYNSAGELLARDIGPGSFASVNFRGVSSGESYWAEIDMYDCDTWVCSAALGSTLR